MYFGGWFSSLLALENRIFMVVHPPAVVGLEDAFYSKIYKKTVEATLVWRCRSCAYILYGVYTCISHIRRFYFIALPMAEEWKWSCVPLLLFWEGVSVWVGRVGSVFWDCSWRCQGTNREKRAQNKREGEERGKGRHTLAEKHHELNK